MPIDDALENMDKGKEEKKTKTEPAKTNLKYLQPWHEEIIKSYLKKIDASAQKSNIANKGLNIPVVELYGPWIRFNENLFGKIIPVPKSQVIQVFLDTCPTHVKELLDNSDLREYLEELPDAVDLHKIKSYNIPECMQIESAVGYKDLLFFEMYANNFIIPDLNCLSLFAENGKTLREYAKFAPKPDKSILSLVDLEFGMNTFFVPFDVESMLRFCRATGTKKIKKTMDEVNTLLTDLKKLCEDAKELTQGAGSSYKDSITEYLSERLQKYNPELVLKERQDTMIDDGTVKKAKTTDLPAGNSDNSDDIYFDNPNLYRGG